MTILSVTSLVNKVYGNKILLEHFSTISFMLSMAAFSSVAGLSSRSRQRLASPKKYPKSLVPCPLSVNLLIPAVEIDCSYPAEHESRKVKRQNMSFTGRPMCYCPTSSALLGEIGGEKNVQNTLVEHLFIPSIQMGGKSSM